MRYEQVIVISIAIGIAVSLSWFTIAFAQVVTKEDIKTEDTISNTDLRKSFGYCPLDASSTALLDKYGVTYTIESCPMSRVYIENWDKLDLSTQQAIVDELQLNGFRMEKE